MLKKRDIGARTITVTNRITVYYSIEIFGTMEPAGTSCLESLSSVLIYSTNFLWK